NQKLIFWTGSGQSVNNTNVNVKSTDIITHLRSDRDSRYLEDEMRKRKDETASHLCVSLARWHTQMARIQKVNYEYSKLIEPSVGDKSVISNLEYKRRTKSRVRKVRKRCADRRDYLPVLQRRKKKKGRTCTTQWPNYISGQIPNSWFPFSLYRTFAHLRDRSATR
ncbi:hypothetical protein DFH11DRAFT_1617773, partial [Phellopilus nigrolimitatus]